MNATTSAFAACQIQYEKLIGLAERFMELAWWAALAVILVSVVSTVAVWAKGAGSQARLLDGVAPSATLDSLKGLIDSLKSAPAWFAIFLAGAALLWAANSSAKSCITAAAGVNAPQLQSSAHSPKQ